MEALPEIELFAIGTELALGRVQDTNSFWIAQQVAEMGGRLRRISVVIDSVDEIVEALEGAVRRGTRILITTGGLGPTPDDLTVEAVARLVGCKTGIHEPTLAEYRRRRGLVRREDATPNMIKMATVPESAEVMMNPAGWAPGLKVAFGEAVILIMPGPPREVMPLFEQFIGPYIASRLPGKTAAARVAVLLPESELSSSMEEVMRRFPSCYLKAYVALRSAPSQPLPLDVVARGADEDAARETLRQALDLLSELVQQKGRTLEAWDE